MKIEPFLLRCFECGQIFDQNMSRKACTYTCTHCDAMEMPWSREHERIELSTLPTGVIQ